MENNIQTYHIRLLRIHIFTYKLFFQTTINNIGTIIIIRIIGRLFIVVVVLWRQSCITFGNISLAFTDSNSQTFHKA